MRNGPDDLLDCGHPAAAWIDHPNWGWCGACAQQSLPPDHVRGGAWSPSGAEVVLQAAAPSRLAPRWDQVAPLLQRWQIALVPHRDGAWDVLAGFDRPGSRPWIGVQGRPGQALSGVQEARYVAFAQLPQAIADVAARCEAEEKGEGGGKRLSRERDSFTA